MRISVVIHGDKHTRFLCNDLGRDKAPQLRHQACFLLNRPGEEEDPTEESRRCH